jgi:uncharacterized membrane protein YcaP (DUF421 family)
MDKLLFNGWEQIIRTIAVGALAYVCLVVLLRISGKRTLSKLNAFDFVVTVALGSTLATILLNADVALAEGVTALGLLIGLQFLVTWSSVRLPWVRRIVTGEPTLLAYRGELLHDALRGERVADEEVLAAVRAEGLLGLGDSQAVVLETDGSITVLHSGTGDGPASLAAVHGSRNYRDDAKATGPTA